MNELLLLLENYKKFPTKVFELFLKSSDPHDLLVYAQFMLVHFRYYFEELNASDDVDEVVKRCDAVFYILNRIVEVTTDDCHLNKTVRNIRYELTSEYSKLHQLAQYEVWSLGVVEEILETKSVEGLYDVAKVCRSSKVLSTVCAIRWHELTGISCN